MRILIVDDDPDLREILSFILQREGHEVLAAPDGETALECWREEAPDLLLVDLRLPGISGWDVCERVRAEAATPVVILSVADEAAALQRAHAIGVADYITKPFSPSSLVAAIRRVFATGPELADRPA